MSFLPNKEKSIFFPFNIPNTNNGQYNGAANTYQLLGNLPNLTNSAVGTNWFIGLSFSLPNDFNKAVALSLVVVPLQQGNKLFTIVTELRHMNIVNESLTPIASASESFTPDYTALAAIGNKYLHLCPNGLLVLNNNLVAIRDNGGLVAMRVNYPGSVGGAINTKHLGVNLLYI